ncbi:5'-3' exonuclease H3TH domain-containing protein [Patescibacteria group bacterium]
MPKKQKKINKLVLIDGHALIHRAYHAYPPLTTSQGELINAVYGFVSILLTSLFQLNAKYVAVTFDKKAPTFRHKQYKKYKAHRPKVDKELIDQIGRVHEVVESLNIPIFEVDGFEADDVIGTLAQKAGENLEVVIVTGDHDALQLVNSYVRVFMPGRGKKPAITYDKKAFFKKYGFKPKLLIDFKALAGDAGDGIPGVKGIGPKTATNLILQFGTVEEIYKNIDKVILTASLLDKLKKGKKQAFLSKELATIVCQVPLKFNLKKCKLLDYNKEKVTKLFTKLEFNSLLKKLPTDGWDKITEKMDKGKSETKKEDKKGKQMDLF